MTQRILQIHYPNVKLGDYCHRLPYATPAIRSIVVYNRQM